MRELNAIAVIAYRDILKFLRDRPRLVSTLIFPFVFVGALGGSLQANLGESAGYNFMTFVFTGVFAQTLFQSSTMGIVSLMSDRQTDFSQEMFVSPISRYSIVFGKILGESLVSLAQGVAIVIFGLLLRVPFTLAGSLSLIPVAIVICLMGGSFGLLLLANVSDQRTVQQLFPFIMFPQFFLAGVFAPVKVLPWFLEVLSRISPLRYAVDLARNVFYLGNPDYDKVVLDPPVLNAAIMAGLFVVFILAGTTLFVRTERNR
ncbi:MAG TPA: ABC transporter permease [Chloroflexota bacterium]|nr:ABC transporter permease [Chloroflexota bacterium]